MMIDFSSSLIHDRIEDPLFQSFFFIILCDCLVHANAAKHVLVTTDERSHFLFQPSRKGFIVPNERGYLEPLSKYDSQNGKSVRLQVRSPLQLKYRKCPKQIVLYCRLQLPGNLTVFDINWFSVYDTEVSRSLGYVIIPGRRTSFIFPHKTNINQSIWSQNPQAVT